MPYWIWSLLAIALFVPVLVRVLTWLTIRGLRFQRGGIRSVPETAIPDWEKEVLRGADGILEAQGFRFAGFVLQKDWIAGKPDIRSAAIYESRSDSGAGPIWAWVRQSDSPTPQAPYLISYLSCFVNGRLLATRNMDPDLETISLPYLTTQFPLESSWDAAFKTHADRHQDLSKEAAAERIPLEALIFLRDKCDADTIDILRAKGHLIPAEGSSEKPSVKGAWFMARGALRWRGPMAKIGKAWSKRKERYPLPPMAEARSFLRMQRHAPKTGAMGKGVLVLASLLVYAVVWGKGETWGNAAIFIAILFFHEMGHAVAMRWVGYRDVNIFFIPFFGAMATGKPGRSIPAWKEAIVLLAGPVPGLLLGAWIFSASYAWITPELSQAAILALVINGLNLLPISPLDGGKLMELILFRKTPRLGQIFMAASGLALIAGAYHLREPLLGAIGFVVLLAASKAHRQAQLLLEWRKETGVETVAEGPGPARTIAEIFRRLSPESPAPFAQKAMQVKSILAALPMQAPGLPVSAGLFIVYLACWSAPAYILAARYWLPMNRFKILTRADMKPAELAIHDGLCADSSVLDLKAVRLSDSLILNLRAVSGDDTARIRTLSETWLVEKTDGAEDPSMASSVADTNQKDPIFAYREYGWREMKSGGIVRITIHAPAWRLGELDSSLVKGLVSTYPEEEEWDEAVDTLPPSDSALAAYEAYGRRIDSLAQVEAGVWRSWSGPRKKEWLAAMVAKRRSQSDTLRCWKPSASLEEEGHAGRESE